MTETTTTAPITLTEAAITRLDALLEQDGSADALRLGVTGGGCSGFQYALGLDHSADALEDDMVFEQGVVKVIVDETSLPFLEGATLDYDDSITGQGFTFINPNASGGCGCGQSFSANCP